MHEQERREKIVKGLECLARRRGVVHTCTPDICPYGDLHTCEGEIARDVLALLEEQERDLNDMREDLQDTLRDNLRMAELLEAQEPVAPTEEELYDRVFWNCGNCGEELFADSAYCLKCGRQVKWK